MCVWLCMFVHVRKYLFMLGLVEGMYLHILALGGRVIKALKNRFKNRNLNVQL